MKREATELNVCLYIMFSLYIPFNNILVMWDINLYLWAEPVLSSV